MNSFAHRFFLLGLLVCFTGISPASAAPAKAGRATDGGKTAVDFARTKARIDALLTLRLKPTTLPGDMPNPFDLPHSLSEPTTLEKDPKPVNDGAPGSDSEMLLYYGASMRISGTVRIDDVTHLVINQSPYKEGDLFTIKTKDTVTKLRIVQIAPGELTIGLNDAVQVVKFKK